MGLLFGTFVMVGVSPRLNFKLGLESYHPYQRLNSLEDSIILNDMNTNNLPEWKKE